VLITLAREDNPTLAYRQRRLVVVGPSSSACGSGVTPRRRPADRRASCATRAIRRCFPELAARADDAASTAVAAAALDFAAGAVAVVLRRVASVAAGFAIIWALAWRRQERAVAAIEERDGVRFYVDKTSPLQAIRLIRTPASRASDGRWRPPRLDP
jgi:hypothetical protein